MKSDKFQVLYLKPTGPDRKKSIHKETSSCKVPLSWFYSVTLRRSIALLDWIVFPAHFLSFYIAPSSVSISYQVPPK